MKLGNSKLLIVKTIFIVFLIIFSVITTISYLYSISIINKDMYFKLLLNDTYGNNFYITLVETISNKFNPIKFLEINNNNYKLENRVDIKPKIYIYSNSNLNYKSEYNIMPNLLTLSYFFSEELNNLNIPTIYENTDIKLFSKNNNITTEECIKVFIEDKKKNYNLDYIIELGINNNTFKIGKYAPIYLHANEDNFMFISKLNNILNKKVPNISKIYIDTEYNEVLKIDIGGTNNYMGEALRSTKILSSSIYEVLNE